MEILKDVQAMSNDNMKKMSELQEQMLQLQRAMGEMITAKSMLGIPEKATLDSDEDSEVSGVTLRYVPKLLKNDLSGRILCHVTRTLSTSLHRYLFPSRHFSGLYHSFDLICDNLEIMGVFRETVDSSHLKDNQVNVIRERWGVLQKKYSLDHESMMDYKMVMSSINEEYSPLYIPNLSKDHLLKVIDTFMPEKDAIFNASCKELATMWEDIVVNKALEPGHHNVSM